MKKTIFIILSVLVMTGLVIYVAFRSNEDKYIEFKSDGYIISINDNETLSANKHYFNEGTKYKNKYPSKIVFEDTEGDKVTTEQESFVHYTDGSISVLKKSVILNLANLNNELIEYYNLFKGQTLSHVSGSYFIENATSNLKFTDYIIKVDDNKYLIAGSNINLSIDGESKPVNEYIEVTFFDGDITRIDNQEVSYQTVSAESYVKIGDNTKVNLSNQGVYLSGVRVLTLSQMVIDSDDNIPIIEEDKSDETSDDESDDNENSSTNQQGGIQGGNDVEENVVDEEENLSVPTLSIIEMEVTSNKINASIEIKDDDNLLSSNITIKIINNETGKIVYLNEEMSGVFNINVLVENLKPETSYTLKAEADYTKNAIVYTRDFISKTFRTEPLGISLEKNFYSKEMLSYNVVFEEYSGIEKAEVQIYSVLGERLSTINALRSESGEDGKVLIDFIGLTANTTYIVKLTNILYDNIVISTGYEEIIYAKTLKNKPTFGSLSYILDKKNGDIIMNLDNVSDEDAGIKEYRYEVYDARTLSVDGIKAVTSVVKNTYGTASINIDEKNLFRGVPYVFKVVVTFYDNEKYYEYQTNYSEVMKMDGVSFPALLFTKDIVTFERIKGIITIVDLNNAIGIETGNTIKVVYTNSIGISLSFTTSGNLSIPIDINDLRAGDTYNISVYATVDLQDGNEIIDECYIGSIIVNTPATNPFVANMQVDQIDVTNAFKVNARLGTKPGVDNTLEANTLTGITFTLYEGQSVSAVAVRTLPKIDTNPAQYSSTLKSNFYDKEFYITPEFFGISNTDVTGNYYTISITEAHDYTSYLNNIPIENNTIIVQSKGYIPEVPSNTDDSLEVNLIRNKDAGDHYDEELDDTTIVGYKIKANYNNSQKYARTITYYVHKANGEKITNLTRQYIVPASGELDYIYFYLGKGTPFATADNTFNRGNSYYFSYDAELDLNYDNIAETTYPVQEEGTTVVLKSSAISPNKQAPKFLMYPSISSGDSFIWKYMYTDIDNAIYEKTFNYSINNKEIAILNYANSGNDFLSITFANLTAGYLKVTTNVALMKERSSVLPKTLIYQYFDGVYNPSGVEFHAQLESNRILISIVDYETHATLLSKVSSVKITFTTDDDTVIIDNKNFINGTITTDLTNIASLIGKPITITVDLLYDSGIEGFDVTSNYYALKTIKTDSITSGQYLTITADDYFAISDNATESKYIVNYNFENLIMDIEDQIYNRTKTLQTYIKEKGIHYNLYSKDEYFSLKSLKTYSVPRDNSDEIMFTTIIPGISILRSEGVLDIAPALKDAAIMIDFYGAGGFTEIENNEIIIDLYETNQDDSLKSSYVTYKFPISSLSNPIVLDNLIPITKYAFMVYVNIIENDAVVKTQLYDVDFKSNREIYRFTTLSGIGINTISHNLIARSYEDKTLSFGYYVTRTKGYDRIEYDLYKVLENGTKERVDITFSDDTFFTETMSKTVAIPPGTPLEFGENYEIVIRPITIIDLGESVREVELEQGIYDFYLKPLLSPFFRVTSTSNDNDGLDFKVSIFDTNKVIVGGTYRIEVYNSSNARITPSAYFNVTYSTNSYNRLFSINNLEGGSEYYFDVITTVDMANDMATTTQKVSRTRATTVDVSGIDVGTLYTAMNSNDRSLIDLLFYNSYQLNLINQIRYSIYSSAGYALDRTIEFSPNQFTSLDNELYYAVTLNDSNLPSTGIYYLEIQFLYNNKIVSTKSIEHNYT